MEQRSCTLYGDYIKFSSEISNEKLGFRLPFFHAPPANEPVEVVDKKHNKADNNGNISYMSPMHQITTKAVNVTKVSMVIP